MSNLADKRVQAATLSQQQAEANMVRYEELTLDAVTFSYPGSPKPLFSGLTWTIRGPARYAIVGRNGSGKSTLLRQARPDLAEGACREALAHFLFRREAVFRPVGQLSGWERLRLALAIELITPDVPKLLLLDEPTDHLDRESMAQLEQLLRDYRGAMVVVSHGESFLARVGIGERPTIGA